MELILILHIVILTYSLCTRMLHVAGMSSAQLNHSDLLWLLIRSWFFFSVSSYSHVLCAVTSFCIRIPSGRHYESHFFVNGDLLLLSVFLPWVSVERTINATYYTSILEVQALLIMFKPQLVEKTNSTFVPTSPTSKVISLYHLSISNIVILMTAFEFSSLPHSIVGD